LTITFDDLVGLNLFVAANIKNLLPDKIPQAEDQRYYIDDCLFLSGNSMTAIRNMATPRK
jgi:hypothetical protein